MPLFRKKKGLVVSDIPIQFRPYRRDFEVLESICKAEGKDRPEIVRMIVNDWIKNRNLKAVGKDQATEAVIAIQKKTMNEVLAPLLERVNVIESNLRRVEGKMAVDFDHAHRQLKFLNICARFIIKELIICRLLLRDYVHTIYRKLVESLGKQTKDLEANFNARVENFRGEADVILDELTEDSASELHELAGQNKGFSED